MDFHNGKNGMYRWKMDIQKEVSQGTDSWKCRNITQLQLVSTVLIPPSLQLSDGASAYAHFYA